MTGDGSRRAILLGIIVAAALGVSLANAMVGSSAAPSSPSWPPSAVVSGTAAHTSAWYCAAGAVAPAGSQAVVLLTNSGPRPVTGSLESAPAGPKPGAGQAFTVPPDRQLAVGVGLGAVSVLLDGGGVGVSERLSGPQGSGAAPCASRTDTSWYFAHGSTASGDGLQVALFDPLPTPAVVNVSFVSASAGTVVPPAYQGIPVAPGAVVTEDVHVHVPNDGALATEVTALSGSVAAAEVDESAGPDGGPGGGLSIVDGVTSPSRQWAFAQDADPSGAGNVFSILNPSSSPATVSVSVVLAQGQAAPIVMRLPPDSTASLAAQDQTRIPAGTLYGLVFSSADGPGIVVSRQSSSPGGSPVVGMTAAQPGGIQRWLVAPGSPGQSPWRLSVVNLAGHPVHVSIDRLAAGRAVPLAGHDGVVLAPGNLDVVSSASAPVGSSPVEVRADGPVAVELDPVPAGIPGIATVPVWPLAVLAR